MDADKYSLKPCPFCGSPARLEEIKHGEMFGSIIGWSPYCTAIGTTDECIAGHTLLVFSRKIEAVEAWNRRNMS